jgi:hypothetical protein
MWRTRSKSMLVTCSSSLSLTELEVSRRNTLLVHLETMLHSKFVPFYIAQFFRKTLDGLITEVMDQVF